MYDWLKNVTPRYHAYHGVPIYDIPDPKISQQLDIAPRQRLLPPTLLSLQSWFTDCTAVRFYCRFYCIAGQSSVGDLLFFFFLSFLIRLL